MTCLFGLFGFFGFFLFAPNLIPRDILRFRVRIRKAPILNEHNVADFDLLLLGTFTQGATDLTNALLAIVAEAAHTAISEHRDGAGIILIGVATEEFVDLVGGTGRRFLTFLEGFTATEIA